ncbi:hypothetical protein H8L32_23040 [Undibacterium sp. CY18W]|uniref:Uncharacterized protein n=1 Tax=Undibacterium hunanense TaxID=2762292 RepID=A0ABR6ZWV9_9BURK|nr:hypothetical protein [Undibacterium hunanense]MBC3920358.1 hypothetical protein [Undibacterium hunanense]
MPTTPPSYTPPPANLPQRGDRTTFSNRVDAFISWLGTGMTDMGALTANAYANALAAFNSATAASTSEGNAANSATTANTFKTAAADSATAAAASAAMANSAVNSPTYTDLSTSNLTIAVGTQTLTVASGKNWAPGMSLLLFNSAGKQMIGRVTSYTGNTLVVNVSSITGSGSYASWYISTYIKTLSRGRSAFIGSNS